MRAATPAAEVGANLIGTYIDILKAFLYAQDPDVDVMPAKSVEPPTIEAMRDAAEQWVDQDAQAQTAIAQAVTDTAQQASWAALAGGQDPAVVATQAGQMAAEQAREEAIQQRIQTIQQAYRRRQQNNKAFAETCEIVISALWQKAHLKMRGRSLVQSGLTIGPGWLKATWQERKGMDPVTRQKMNDLRDNIAKAAKLRADMEEQQGAELDATTAEYELQLKALQAEGERIIARGFAIDFVPAEDMQVAPGVPLECYLDAPWLAQRTPMRTGDAGAEFNLDDETIRKALVYHEREPVMHLNESPGVKKPDAKDADTFEAGSGNDADCEPWVMVWEIWDRDTDSVLTAIEGIPCWVREPATPTPTSRFYAFFLLAFGTIDGQRHPQSYTSRSAKLVDEYNRIGSAEAVHRRRIVPKTAFNAGLIDETEAKKLAGAGSQEMVALNFANPNANIREALLPVAYAAMDAALYDRSRVVQELERIWGVQEALQGAINTAKTATEAQIQQTGMQARTGAMRDLLEDLLSDLAQYTLEVAMKELSDEDVRGLAGPDALWPQYQGPDDLARLVNVEIRAGSSGKPNTTAERQAWSTLLPMLQAGIGQIAQLRGSAPADVADSMEKLLRMTIERSGDRFDVDSLLPPPGQPAMPGMPGAGVPGMPGAEGATPPASPAAAAHDPANAGAPINPMQHATVP
jgi:hypothetical protein